MSAVAQAKRIVVKVGTSTLTYENGKLNLRRTEELCKVLSDLHNSGLEVVLVSSGAVGVGMGKLGIKERPTETEKKQAIAAVGQCELMFMYDKLFGEYNCMVAQVLLTADVTASENSKRNVENTFRELLNMDIDTLSAVVAKLVGADLLIILTDIDGLYDTDPRENPNAKHIPYVTHITDEIKALAGDAGTNRGTGGMVTKIRAAQIANEAGISCCVMSGTHPKNLYQLLDGVKIGTTFAAL